jgi:hypothetical protein
MTTDEKKSAERWQIEEARRRSKLFPAGELSPYESPDWLIRDASIGVEVSELLPPKGTNLFSGAQILSFQHEIVANAQQYYCEKGYPEVDVLVFFKNEWNRKGDALAIGVALADFIKLNLPTDTDTVNLQRRGGKPWVDGLGVIRISRTGRRWQAGGTARGQLVRQDDVAARIAAKDRKVPLYRSRLPGFQIWLLLTTDIRVLRSVGIPSDVSEWRFTFGFDKVLLMPWDGDVIALARN